MNRYCRKLSMIAVTALLAASVLPTVALAQPPPRPDPGEISAYFAGFDLYPEAPITYAQIRSFKVPELDCTNGGGQFFGLGHATAPFSNAVLAGLSAACGGGTPYYQTIAEACGASDIGAFAAEGDKIRVLFWQDETMTTVKVENLTTDDVAEASGSISLCPGGTPVERLLFGSYPLNAGPQLDIAPSTVRFWGARLNDVCIGGVYHAKYTRVDADGTKLKPGVLGLLFPCTFKLTTVEP